MKQLVRETEVLVYAVGIDGQGSRRSSGRTPPVQAAAAAHADSVSVPGRRTRRRRTHSRCPAPAAVIRRAVAAARGGTYSVGGADDRVNVMALREMTDDSGGRTEIVRDARDLDPAVASIADELSQQVPTSVIRAPATRTAAGTRFVSKCAIPR